MLEIILIIFLCSKMRSVLRGKGWEKTFGMQFLVVVVYLGSLFIGGAFYGAYIAITQGAEAVEDIGYEAYLAAYVSAIICVGSLFLSTKLIKEKEALSS